MILGHFKNLLIQIYECDLKPNFPSKEIKSAWSRESKGFSISMVTRYSLLLNFSNTSTLSEKSLLDSFMNLFAT